MKRRMKKGFLSLMDIVNFLLMTLGPIGWVIVKLINFLQFGGSLNVNVIPDYPSYVSYVQDKQVQYQNFYNYTVIKELNKKLSKEFTPLDFDSIGFVPMSYLTNSKIVVNLPPFFNTNKLVLEKHIIHVKSNIVVPDNAKFVPSIENYFILQEVNDKILVCPDIAIMSFLTLPLNNSNEILRFTFGQNLTKKEDKYEMAKEFIEKYCDKVDKNSSVTEFRSIVVWKNFLNLLRENAHGTTNLNSKVSTLVSLIKELNNYNYFKSGFVSSDVKEEDFEKLKQYLKSSNVKIQSELQSNFTPNFQIVKTLDEAENVINNLQGKNIFYVNESEIDNAIEKLRELNSRLESYALLKAYIDQAIKVIKNSKYSMDIFVYYSANYPYLNSYAMKGYFDSSAPIDKVLNDVILALKYINSGKQDVNKLAFDTYCSIFNKRKEIFTREPIDVEKKSIVELLPLFKDKIRRNSKILKYLGEGLDLDSTETITSAQAVCQARKYSIKNLVVVENAIDEISKQYKDYMEDIHEDTSSLVKNISENLELLKNLCEDKPIKG